MSDSDITTIRVETKHNFWENIGGLLQNTNYSDVSIICGDGVEVKSNAVLLSSINPWIYQLLLEQSEHEHITLVTPDIDSEQVEPILNAINENFQTGAKIDGSKTFDFLPYFMFHPNFKNESNFISFTTKITSDVHELNDVKSEFDWLDDDKHPDLSDIDDEEDNVQVTKKQKQHKIKPKQSRECHVCHKVSSSQETWRAHLRRIHPLEHAELNKKPSTKLCTDCGKEFGNIDPVDVRKYAQHARIHKLDKFQCDCNMTFKTLTQKDLHIRVVHMGWTQCPQCTYSFQSKDLLEKHVMKNHSEKIVCEVCGAAACDANALKNHMLRMHDPTLIKCKVCDATVEGNFRLEIHMKRVHGDRQLEQCKICGDSFIHLRRHMRNFHQGVKNFQCDKCEKGFVSKSLLEKHNMSVHIKSRPYGCRYGSGCTMSYNDVSNRNSHEKKKHGALFKNSADIKELGKKGINNMDIRDMVS